MIQITNDLFIAADGHCFILGKPRTRPGRSVVLDETGYYATASQAVRAAVLRTMRQGVADGSIKTLRQFIEEQARLQAELERLIAPLEPGQGLEGG